MEKGPETQIKGPETRIIGNASPKTKEQVKKAITEALFNHFESQSPEEQEQLEKFEYPKSEKEIALINFANKETALLMQEAGIEPYDVPAGNYHIIPTELYRKIVGNDGNATTLMRKQGIFFDAQHFRDNPVNFGAVALHETLHLKAHFSMEVQEDGDTVSKTRYREGLMIHSLQNSNLGKYHYHCHFAGLNEGIVAESEKRLLLKLLDLPELAEEKEWLTSDEAKKIKKKLAEKDGIPEDDIIWVGKKGEDDGKIVSYGQQRNVLNYVCAEIQKQFPDQYASADDVYKTFLNASFTGRLLPLGRLVEKTFGEGNFRLLGNMDTERPNATLHLESLKKARARQVKMETLPS